MEKLERYKGELTLEQLISARNKIIENAKALYEEATLLYENSKFARAYFLLCIANEELGKSLIVTSAVVGLITEKIDWHRFWKRLRNHKDKTKMIEHAENILISSDKEYISTALYLISTPNTGLFFAYRSIYCGFVGASEPSHCGLSLICRLNLLKVA